MPKNGQLEYQAPVCVDEGRGFDAWYDAFGIKPGDALYLPPERRVRIW
jgi:predicted metalloendopeptidase